MFLIFPVIPRLIFPHFMNLFLFNLFLYYLVLGYLGQYLQGIEYLYSALLEAEDRSGELKCYR